jgi:hypothetical protein
MNGAEAIFQLVTVKTTDNKRHSLPTKDTVPGAQQETTRRYLIVKLLKEKADKKKNLKNSNSETDFSN